MKQTVPMKCPICNLAFERSSVVMKWENLIVHDNHISGDPGLSLND